MSGREIFLAFDSDAATNPKVQQAEQAFAAYARNRGAIVYVLRLPSGRDGEKVGLDDFLIDKGAAGLNDLMKKARRDTNSSSEGPSLSRQSSTPIAADLADDFLTKEELQSPVELRLRWYRQEWLQYGGRIFQPLPHPDLQARVVRHLSSGPARRKATQYLVNNVMLHLQAICHIPSSQTPPPSFHKR